MKVVRLLISIIFLLAFFTNCKKEEVDLSLLTANHSIAIPLVGGEISVEDMLETDTDTVISQLSDGSLFLAYDNEEISFPIDSLGISIPDINFNESINPNQTGSDIPSFSDVIELSQSETQLFNFEFNGVTPELKTIELSSGILNPRIVNNMSHDIEVIIKIPSLSLNGIIYSDTLPAAAGQEANTSKGLIGWDLDLTLGDLLYNQIVVEVEFKVVGSGSSLTTSDNFELDLKLLNLDYNTIEGDLKNHRFDLDLIDISLDIFDNSSSAINFQLTNPEINFEISNGIGLTTFLGMDTMYYEDLSGIKIDDIEYDSSASNLQVAPFYFPALTSSSSSISINKNNSTISELINNVPKRLLAQPFLEINPDTNSTNNNVITKGNGEVSFSSEILLPLEGYAGGWNMGDTLEFDFKVDSLFTDNTSIDSTEIKFRTTNGWPIDLTLTIELYDADPREDPSLSPITSIANQEIILESGIVDPSTGKVSSSTVKNTVLECNYECVQSLNQTKFIIISAAASTENYNNQQSVKVYNDYNLKLDMALLVTGKIF
tara:strand:+ start:71858 stop:73495 length:1638 start_codon:yes stop_codon:yes gene_type:complete